jgi:hypothetical protein
MPWPEGLWLRLRPEDAECAVDMRQIGPMLIKLLLQLVDDLDQLAVLRDQAGDDLILIHAAALCQ